MKARVRAYSPDGGTLLGTLRTVGMSFSIERGGKGSLTFDARTTHLDALGAWDSVLRVELETAPATWTAVAAFALRPSRSRERIGGPLVRCTANALLQHWAEHTLLFPEYGASTIPKRAGSERVIGWMASAYDPTSDPREAWDGVHASPRTAMPTDWPAGASADWISVTGASDESERKLFLATITLAHRRKVRLWFSGDEDADVYIAGEPVLSWSASEDQGEAFDGSVRMVLQPGTYAVAVDTNSVWSEGGDGTDPILLAMATIVDGSIGSWILESNTTDWVACRRDADPPGNEPPGPTPGAMLGYLIGEAQDRGAAGWAGVALGFDADVDSYGVDWPTAIVERVLSLGSDTYQSVFDVLAADDEVDVWLDPDLTLQAAPSQGQDLTATVTLTSADVAAGSDEWPDDDGTWVAAHGLAGWVHASAGTGLRLEYAIEVGTALSHAVAQRSADAAVAENGRWDGSLHMRGNPTFVPLVDFQVGDRVGLDYLDAPVEVEVLSISATAGKGGLMWDLEVAAVPA